MRGNSAVALGVLLASILAGIGLIASEKGNVTVIAGNGTTVINETNITYINLTVINETYLSVADNSELLARYRENTYAFYHKIYRMSSSDEGTHGMDICGKYVVWGVIEKGVFVYDTDTGKAWKIAELPRGVGDLECWYNSSDGTWWAYTTADLSGYSTCDNVTVYRVRIPDGYYEEVARHEECIGNEWGVGALALKYPYIYVAIRTAPGAVFKFWFNGTYIKNITLPWNYAHNIEYDPESGYLFVGGIDHISRLDLDLNILETAEFDGEHVSDDFAFVHDYVVIVNEEPVDWFVAVNKTNFSDYLNITVPIACSYTGATEHNNSDYFWYLCWRPADGSQVGYALLINSTTFETEMIVEQPYEVDEAVRLDNKFGYLGFFACNFNPDECWVTYVSGAKVRGNLDMMYGSIQKVGQVTFRNYKGYDVSLWIDDSSSKMYTNATELYVNTSYRVATESYVQTELENYYNKTEIDSILSSNNESLKFWVEKNFINNTELEDFNSSIRTWANDTFIDYNELDESQSKQNESLKKWTEELFYESNKHPFHSSHHLLVIGEYLYSTHGGTIYKTSLENYSDVANLTLGIYMIGKIVYVPEKDAIYGVFFDTGDGNCTIFKVDRNLNLLEEKKYAPSGTCTYPSLDYGNGKLWVGCCANMLRVNPDDLSIEKTASTISMIHEVEYDNGYIYISNPNGEVAKLDEELNVLAHEQYFNYVDLVGYAKEFTDDMAVFGDYLVLCDEDQDRDGKAIVLNASDLSLVRTLEWSGWSWGCFNDERAVYISIHDGRVIAYNPYLDWPELIYRINTTRYGIPNELTFGGGKIYISTWTSPNTLIVLDYDNVMLEDMYFGKDIYVRGSRVVTLSDLVKNNESLKSWVLTKDEEQNESLKAWAYSTFVDVSGDTMTGTLTVPDLSCSNCIALGTETTGDYVESITAGGGITVSGSGEGAEVVVSHADTSSQASVDNSGGVVIQDVTLDTYGHVTKLTSVDLDPRYVNTAGDTVSGALTVNGLFTANGGVKFTGGSSSSFVYTDSDTGAIEFTGTSPYIDFKNSGSEDYDVRIQRTGDDMLEVKGGNLKINGYQLQISRPSGTMLYCEGTDSGIKYSLGMVSDTGRLWWAPYDDGAWQWGREFGYDPSINSWYVETSFRSPNLIDKDNPNYYINPYGTSVVRQIKAETGVRPSTVPSVTLSDTTNYGPEVYKYTGAINGIYCSSSTRGLIMVAHLSNSPGAQDALCFCTLEGSSSYYWTCLQI